MAERVKFKFKQLEHTADVKYIVYGKSLKTVFENSVLAFKHCVSRGVKIKSKRSEKIKIKGKDLENLMYLFLDELIYLVDAKNFIVSKSKLKLDVEKCIIKGEIYGDSVRDYKDLDHVKAATYHDMEIKKEKTGWKAVFVLDI